MVSDPNIAFDKCPHAGLYKDDFIGEWHCDDCGKSWPVGVVPHGVEDA